MDDVYFIVYTDLINMSSSVICCPHLFVLLIMFTTFQRNVTAILA